MRARLSLIAGLLLSLAAPALAEPLRIVAAENVYGDIATQIGGPDVSVVSILASPDQDPHLFEANASAARHVSAARIVILNGAGYDPWMARLLDAAPTPHRTVIEIAAVLHRKTGDNPHFWYDPAAMPALAKALAAALAAQDPAQEAGYRRRLAGFEASFGKLADKIAALKKTYAGTSVTATEPIFGYMAEALGLKMRNERFQLAVMNGTEPRASDVAAFQRDLKARAVKVLIHNNQTSQGLTDRMEALAREAGVPVVGVGEMAPQDQRYQDWMLSQLQSLETALAAP